MPARKFAFFSRAIRRSRRNQFIDRRRLQTRWGTDGGIIQQGCFHLTGDFPPNTPTRKPGAAAPSKAGFSSRQGLHKFSEISYFGRPFNFLTGRISRPYDAFLKTLAEK